MENLIYILLIVAYLIFQSQMMKKKKEQQEAAKRKPLPGANSEAPRPQTVQDRMKEIFREMEMNKPYSRPQRPIPAKKAQAPASSTAPKPPQKTQKKEPKPFLDVDMTKEEVLPEGTPSKMAQDIYEEQKISNYDYNASNKAAIRHKIDLRQAIIANVILNRPNWE
jgi:hypothetical protein